MRVQNLCSLMLKNISALLKNEVAERIGSVLMLLSLVLVFRYSTRKWVMFYWNLVIEIEFFFESLLFKTHIVNLEI